MSRLICISGADPSPQTRGDVVFIHGLDGDARGTWESRGGAFWPDWLAADLPAARVWSLDYDAASIAWRGTAMPLVDRAANVLDLLCAHGVGTLPLAFIAHSLGGLLAKQVLRVAREYNHSEWTSLAANTRGVVFLATPHSGSEKAGWVNALGALLLPNDTIADLQAHAPQLRDLNLWYRNNAPQLGIATRVYTETRKTKGLLIVDPTSADPGMPGVIPVPIDADHINICKLEDKGQVYGGVRNFVVNVLEQRAQAAQPKVQVSYRVRPLDGRCRLPLQSGEEAYPDGFKFRLYLTNSGSSPVLVETIAPLHHFTPASADLRFAPDLANMRFGDAVTPHQLFLQLTRAGVQGHWLMQINQETAQIRTIDPDAGNLLETDPPTVFSIAPGASELIHGAVTARDPGLHRFAFSVVLGGEPCQTQEQLVLKLEQPDA